MKITCTQHMKIICVHMNNTWRSSGHMNNTWRSSRSTHEDHLEDLDDLHVLFMCPDDLHVLFMCTHTHECVSWCDRFHWKCYTPEIHQIQKLKLLGTNSNEAKISIWICTARYRGIWVSRSGGFRRCSNFSGNSQNCACGACASGSLCTWSIFGLRVQDWKEREEKENDIFLSISLVYIHKCKALLQYTYTSARLVYIHKCKALLQKSCNFTGLFGNGALAIWREPTHRGHSSISVRTACALLQKSHSFAGFFCTHDVFTCMMYVCKYIQRIRCTLHATDV